MATDTLISYISIAEGEEPDWTAAREALAEINDEELEDLAIDLRTIAAGPASPSEVRAALSAVIDRVEQAISDGPDELWTIQVPGWLVYVAGKRWGDSSTVLFDDFCDFDEAGLLEAAGFYVRKGVEISSAEPQPAKSAEGRPKRYARLTELLEPRLVFGPEFSPLTRFVFLTDDADVDGCYETLEQARAGFGDRGSEYNRNLPPPLLIDLDAPDLELQQVTYDRVCGMSVDPGLLLENEDSGEILGSSIDERRRLIGEWAEEWLNETW